MLLKPRKREETRRDSGEMASSLDVVNTIGRVPILRSTIVRAQTDSESSPSHSDAPPSPSRMMRYSELENDGKWTEEEEEDEEVLAVVVEGGGLKNSFVEGAGRKQLESIPPVERTKAKPPAVAEEVKNHDGRTTAASREVSPDDAWRSVVAAETTRGDMSRIRVRGKEWERHTDNRDHRDRDREKFRDTRDGDIGRIPRNIKENDGLHRSRDIEGGGNPRSRNIDGFSRSMDINGLPPGGRDLEGLPRNTDSDGYNGTRGNDFERERGFYRDAEKQQRNDTQPRDRDRDRDRARDEGPRAADHHHVVRRDEHYFSSRPGGGHERKDTVGDVMQSSYSTRRDRDRDRRGQQGLDDRDENVGGGQTGRPRYGDGESGDLQKSQDADIDRRRPVQRGRDRGGGQDLPIAPALNSIHRATVHSIRPFGIFVRFDGYRNHGLVHLSQVSDHEVTKKEDSEEAKVQALASVAGEGDQVWVKVISVKVEEDGSTKVACSLKYVNQGNGQDLDPNNVQLEQKISRPPWREPQKLKLEAIYNVQCTRCGGHGHLKKECYSSGDKMYELLPEEEDLDNLIRSPTRGKGPMQKETQAPIQPSKLQAGISSQLLSSGSVGRGRAMVQPAWMKHGIGVGGPVPTQPVADDPKERTNLPDKVTTVQEAVAVIARLKEEKSRRREERHRRKEKRQSHRDAKKEKHRKRHHHEEGFADKEHYSNHKRHHK